MIRHFFLPVMLFVAGWTAASARVPEGGMLVRLTHDGFYKQRPAWSPDGKRLVFARHRGDEVFLFVVDADGSGERRLTRRDDPEYDATWSPDGTRLAFSLVKVSGTQGDLEVYTIGADGSRLEPLAVTQGKLSHEESPAWSPDGKQVAFTSTRDGNQELYVANADGSNVRRLTNDPALDVHPCWSPDSNRIAFATSRWGDFELAVVKRDGTLLERVTESPGLDDYPAWSPDGRWLAFTSNREGNFEVFLLEVQTGAVRNLTQHSALDHYPGWAPDGRLAWVSNRDGGFEIYVMTLVP